MGQYRPTQLVLQRATHIVPRQRWNARTLLGWIPSALKSGRDRRRERIWIIRWYEDPVSIAQQLCHAADSRTNHRLSRCKRLEHNVCTALASARQTLDIRRGHAN